MPFTSISAGWIFTLMGLLDDGRPLNQGKSLFSEALTTSVESISKQQVYDGLAKATANCKTKSPYGKGEHSFKILALIAPEKVMDKSPWASRFVEELKKKMGVDR